MKKRFDLEQVSELTRVPKENIVRFVSYSWVLPAGDEDQIFDQEDIARIRLIYELQEILGINHEAVPIVMHLIDQINHLHREIRKNKI